MLYMQLGEEEEENKKREGAKHDTMTRRIKKNSRLCTSLPRAQSKSFVTEKKKNKGKEKEGDNGDKTCSKEYETTREILM